MLIEEYVLLVYSLENVKQMKSKGAYPKAGWAPFSFVEGGTE